VANISGSQPGEPTEYSVGELLRNRMGDDRWHLALVQRDEVWDVERMGRLLDSLLAGYPVGALLLCRTDSVASKVVDRDEGEETVREARAGAYQLLDGQQRLNALYTMLTASDEKHRKYGRFYLDLTVARQPPSPAGTGRRGPAMPYLVWREGPDGPLGQGEYDAFGARGRCLNLSRLYVWAEVEGGVARGEALLKSGPEVLAKAIDPQFTHALSGQEREVAAGWLRRILRMWTTPIVPVMRATVGAPEDILELFARLNRSGIPVRDADIYFAAVKTFWNDAEPRLKRVVDASRRGLGAGDGYAFLTMERALRLVSRLAGRGLGGGDVIPLTVERIAGTRREAMVAAMQALTASDSPVLARLDRFFEEHPTKSGLKYGLRFVSHQLWDEVLGWAVTRGHWDDADLQAIDAYLFGGTVFRYATIFGGSFSRSAFVEALAAGVRDEPFPLRAILLATRQKYPTLSFGRRRVAALQSNTGEGWEDRRQLGDLNVALLLTIAQDIDVDHGRPLDIDHIYASALASRMHVPGNSRMHHPERWWVNTIGNMWLLDAGTNRALQDLKPPMKFASLEHWQEATLQTRRVWPTAQWSMTESEISTFIEVDTELDHDIDGAMEKFAELVEARADRLLDAPFERLPDAKLFASDTELAPPDNWHPNDDALPTDLAERLALRDVLDSLEHASPRRPDAPTQPVSQSPRLQSVLANADAAGQRMLLEELLAAADRLGLHARPYVTSVMFTPPTNRTRMLFTAWPETDALHMWMSADAFEEFFPGISADEARRQLGPADEDRPLDGTATREFIAGLERLLDPAAL
jgi:Protein of unknown function DUF262/Protein of unknown function (DUF1524)